MGHGILFSLPHLKKKMPACAGLGGCLPALACLLPACLPGSLGGGLPKWLEEWAHRILALFSFSLPLLYLFLPFRRKRKTSLCLPRNKSSSNPLLWRVWAHACLTFSTYSLGRLGRKEPGHFCSTSLPPHPLFSSPTLPGGGRSPAFLQDRPPLPLNKGCLLLPTPRPQLQYTIDSGLL